jgi:chaperone modulatory protein CbpM
MSSLNVAVGVSLMGDDSLDMDTFAAAAGLDVASIQQLLDEGMLVSSSPQAPWRFDGHALARARRIQRLQRDFDANLQSVAVMLQLLDELEGLHAWLRREGIAPPAPTP